MLAIVFIGLVMIIAPIFSGFIIWLGLHDEQRTIWRNGQFEWRFPELHTGETAIPRTDNPTLVCGCIAMACSVALIIFVILLVKSVS